MRCARHGILGCVTADPGRRLVLTAGAVSLALAGCKGLAALGPPPGPGLDVTTLDRVIAAETLMVARYQGALAALADAAHQGKARTLLESVLAEHQAHLAQLRSSLVVPRGSAFRPRKVSHATPALPGQPREILAALAAAERDAAASLLRAVIAVPAAPAQLLASIGAAEAAHVVLLTRPGLR
jgi:hypothetical protein